MPPHHNHSPHDFHESSPAPLQSEMLVHEPIKIEGLHPFYQFAYEEAQHGFKGRIDMSSFTNRKDLSKDVARVHEKLNLIREKCMHGAEEEKMAFVQSDVFEHMLHKHITDAKWFGDKTKSILPAIYDDLFHGVDLILEQRFDRGAYAFSSLSMDATFSAQGAVKKIEKIMSYLHEGRLGKVKYFKSDAANFKGSMNNVPNFVVGVGRPALFDMVGQYVQKGATPEINQEARRMVLEQIIIQANYYSEFLLSKGFKEEADQYFQVGKNMAEILATIPELTNKKGVDEVHQAILNHCSSVR
jgi:hypothetical protein